VKIHACENFGLPEQRDAFEDTRVQRAVRLIDRREPVGVAVIWIQDRTTAPFIAASYFQSPNDRPAALRRALGWIVEPDNPTADQPLAVEDMQGKAPDTPCSIDR
jgi:hypothetical protein